MKKTIEEIKEKIKKAHGNKYEYPYLDEEYVNSRSKITIICPIHGEFHQTINAHVYMKNGCPKCGGRGKRTLEEIKEKIKEVHGNKYQYPYIDKEYVTTDSKITIICQKHGEFHQTIKSHGYHGSGCPKCFFEKVSKRRTIPLEEIKEKIKNIHGNKYEYPYLDEEYVNLSSIITIICPIHGEFKQTIFCHINSKYGCNKCNYENKLRTKKLKKKKNILKTDKIKEKRKLRLKKVKEKLMQIYGRRYKYPYFDKEFITTGSKITITCKKHGDFKLFLNNHLYNNCGCSKCQKIQRIEEKNKIKLSKYKKIHYNCSI